MDLRSYLAKTGLQAAESSAIAKASTAVAAARERAALAATAHAASPAGEALWSYRVPKLAPGGGCSLPGLLEDEPHRLENALGPATPERREAVSFLRLFLDELQSAGLGADWLGVYVRRERAGEATVLTKVAYLGAPSRADFPLTPEFAAHSNNSTVGLTGRAVLVQDVTAHVASGGAYYACDQKVLSELCVPLFDDEGTVAGIIDAESFQPAHFTPERVLLLAAAAASLGAPEGL